MFYHLTDGRQEFPEWIVPMAATLTQERFTGPEWVFERKFDGIRLLAFKQGGEVRLFSRNRLPQNCPPIATPWRRCPADLILDGEMAWPDRVRYDVFDVVWMAGTICGRCRSRSGARGCARCRFGRRSITSRPLDDPEPWTRACSEGWEGVIAKRRDSRYEHRRSPHWLKMKCEIDRERGRRLYRSAGKPRRAGRAAGRVQRERGFRVCRKDRHRLRYQTAAELRARLDALENPQLAVHESQRAAAPARALGPPRDRRQGRVHRVDGPSQAAPSAAAGSAVVKRARRLESNGPAS